eukprot:COSAG05_NODE_287_length_12131_cov_3.148022_2_plen_150_part_00
MQRIEKLMPLAFAPPPAGSTAAAPPPVAAPPIASSAAPSITHPPIPHYTPAVALVDEVAIGGPAASAGLLVGDQLVSMGELTVAELRGPSALLLFIGPRLLPAAVSPAPALPHVSLPVSPTPPAFFECDCVIYALEKSSESTADASMPA